MISDIDSDDESGIVGSVGDVILPFYNHFQKLTI